MSCSRSSRRSCCFISIFCRDRRKGQPSEPSGHAHQEASVLPTLVLPTWLGRDSAFSQRAAIAKVKAHTWLVKVEISLFQSHAEGLSVLGCFISWGP